MGQGEEGQEGQRRNPSRQWPGDAEVAQATKTSGQGQGQRGRYGVLNCLTSINGLSRLVLFTVSPHEG